MIKLCVPGNLKFRDMALRVVASTCKLALDEPNDSAFVAEVVSAFGEAFNNIAIHAYRHVAGEVVITIEYEPNVIRIRMEDHGESFDPSAIPSPDLMTLPESGLGYFIMTSFMDEVNYTASKPNVLSLLKRRR